MEQTLKRATIVSRSTAAEGGNERKERNAKAESQKEGKTRRKLWHGGGTTRLLLTVLRAGLYSSNLSTYSLG